MQFFVAERKRKFSQRYIPFLRMWKEKRLTESTRFLVKCERTRILVTSAGISVQVSFKFHQTLFHSIELSFFHVRRANLRVSLRLA